MKDKQTLVLFSILLAFASMLGIAFWYGEMQSSGSASATTTEKKPVKKFRAKPGTERKNARALLSSTPSQPEETTNKPIEIWGSLDPELQEENESLITALNALQNEDRPQAIGDVLEQLKKVEQEGGSLEDKALLQATLGRLYALKTPPDEAAAGAAFDRALLTAGNTAARIGVLHLYARSLLDFQEYTRVIDLLEFDFIRKQVFSARTLELEVMRGVAYEQLDRDAEASVAYEEALDRTMKWGTSVDVSQSTIFRQASLRLSKLYREQENSSEATAVARRMRNWLDE